MLRAEKWTKAKLKKANNDMRNERLYWNLSEIDKQRKEEVVKYDDKGDLIPLESGSYPKDVLFVDGETLDPYVMGRVVFSRIYEKEVDDFRMTADLVKGLIGMLNNDAREFGSSYCVMTRTPVELKANIPEKHKELAVVSGMRKFSETVPALHKDMEAVIEEIEACEKEEKEWRKENLEKTAKVLKKIEEDNCVKKKKENKDARRAVKGIQGWYPVYCEMCYSPSKAQLRLCETGQVCFWKEGEEHDDDKKVRMICCRMRMHSCNPKTSEFQEMFRVIENKSEEEKKKEVVNPGVSVLKKAKECFPFKTIVGDTFTELKRDLDKWKPAMKLAPPGRYVDLGLGGEMSGCDKETRRVIYAMNRIDWFNVKIRDLRDTQLKTYFYLGTILERAPEFMEGSKEYEYPPALEDHVGVHVFMDATQLMMGAQRLMTEEEDHGHIMELYWHNDGGTVMEEGKGVPLAEAPSMQKIMNGVAFMIPIQDSRSMMTKNPDGRAIMNKWELGDLAMWGHTVDHAGVQYAPSHPSLNSVWTGDVRSRRVVKEEAATELDPPFYADEKVKEENPIMSPWSKECLEDYANAAGEFAAKRLKKAGEEAAKRDEEMKGMFLKSIEGSIEELKKIKEGFEAEWSEKKKEEEGKDDSETGDDGDSDYEDEGEDRKRKAKKRSGTGSKKGKKGKEEEKKKRKTLQDSASKKSKEEMNMKRKTLLAAAMKRKEGAEVSK